MPKKVWSMIPQFIYTGLVNKPVYPVEHVDTEIWVLAFSQELQIKKTVKRWDPWYDRKSVHVLQFVKTNLGRFSFKSFK